MKSIVLVVNIQSYLFTQQYLQTELKQTKKSNSLLDL